MSIYALRGQRAYDDRAPPSFHEPEPAPSETDVPLTFRRMDKVDHYGGNMHATLTISMQQIERMVHTLIECLPTDRAQALIDDLARVR
jgi:hypothetical protein